MRKWAADAARGTTRRGTAGKAEGPRNPPTAADPRTSAHAARQPRKTAPLPSRRMRGHDPASDHRSVQRLSGSAPAANGNAAKMACRDRGETRRKHFRSRAQKTLRAVRPASRVRPPQQEASSGCRQSMQGMPRARRFASMSANSRICVNQVNGASAEVRQKNRRVRKWNGKKPSHILLRQESVSGRNSLK